jgi:hypothetical protein
MEPESSLPHSQVPATYLYPEPAQSSLAGNWLMYVFIFRAFYGSHDTSVCMDKSAANF